MHLVTGGSGFLGNLIVKKLVEKGEKVRVLDIWDSPDRPKGVEFLNIDICDREGVAKAMNGVTMVHHNVALVPLTKSGDKFWKVNVEGAEIAAQEAAKAGVKSFIHMSSSALYGTPECPITNESKIEPVEIYGRGKLEGEKRVRKICEENGLDLVVIRPRTILGEGRLGIFQILFDWIKDNANIFVIGDGNIPFQFVHAHDLMDLYMLAIEKNEPGVYNVGTPFFNTLREDLEQLISYAGSKSKVKGLPVGATIGTLKTLDKLGLSPLAPWHYLTYHKAFYFDTSPLTNLGWKPKYSNIEMFKESYDWFLENYDKNREVPEGASAHRKSVKEGALKVVKKLSRLV